MHFESLKQVICKMSAKFTLGGGGGRVVFVMHTFDLANKTIGF